MIQDFVFLSRKKGCFRCISSQVYNKNQNLMCWLICTRFRPMELSIKLHTMKSGWFIVCIERLRLIHKNDCISFSKIPFCHGKQCGPDAMLRYVAFICVLTVCQSNLLGVSGLQRVVICLPFKVALFSTHNRST